MSFSQIPVATVFPYAYTTAPSGWALCFGQAISRTTFAHLFALVGTTYGAGDGSTTFNVPDLRGRSIFGKDNMGGSTASRITGGGSGITGTTLGASGGAETHVLTTAQLAAHAHTERSAANSPAYIDTGAGSNLQVDGQPNSAGTTRISTDNSGSGSAHQNTPPAFILNYIIKTN
jgi:microcystin-dependent protein